MAVGVDAAAAVGSARTAGVILGWGVCSGGWLGGTARHAPKANRMLKRQIKIIKREKRESTRIPPKGIFYYR